MRVSLCAVVDTTDAACAQAFYMARDREAAERAKTMQADMQALADESPGAAD